MFSFCRRVPRLRPSVLLPRPRAPLQSKAVLRLLLLLPPLRPSVLLLLPKASLQSKPVQRQLLLPPPLRRRNPLLLPTVPPQWKAVRRLLLLLPPLRPSVLLLLPKASPQSKAVRLLLLLLPLLRLRVKQRRQQRRTLQLYVLHRRESGWGKAMVAAVCCWGGVAVTRCVWRMLWVQRLATAVLARDAAVAAAAESEARLGAATQAALAGWNSTLLASVEAAVAVAQPRGPADSPQKRLWWRGLCVAVVLASIGVGVIIGAGYFLTPHSHSPSTLSSSACRCLPVPACTCPCLLVQLRP